MCDQDGWILTKIFFCMFMAEMESRSINSPKIEGGQYLAILTKQAWSIKDFLWLLETFFLWDTAGSPERVRQLHLARSDSQSQSRIWFLLSTQGASHIMIFSLLLIEDLMTQTLGQTGKSNFPLAFSMCHS